MAFGQSMAKAQRYIADKVRGIAANAVVEDEELLQLIGFHPSRKFSNVKGFVRQARPPHNRLSLFVMSNTGALFDAGLAKCLRNMYGKFDAAQEKRQRAIQAFRQEVNHCPSMIEAKARYTTGACALCGRHRKLCVDHVDPPFVEILQRFLDERGLRVGAVGVRWAQRSEYVLRDPELRRQWHEHHDSLARYQGLCRPCNSSKGSGGVRLRADI